MRKIKLHTLPTRIQAGKLNQVATNTNTQRLTGSKWIGIKKRYEREHPRLCAECERKGMVGNGDELDHIIPLWAGGTNNENNLQWLCIEHHKEKTSKEATIRCRQ
jgi:5-methylcytosine-specific restriction protein A